MPKCPICETEYSNNHRMCDELRCTECYWDLSKYPLTPDGLRQDQENRIEWARDIWKELQYLKDLDEYQALIESNEDLQDRLELEINKQDKFKDEFNAKIKELENKINYLLSEPDRLALRRDQLLNEYDSRNFNNDPNDRKITTTLPMKVVEAIKNNTGYRGIDEWLRNYAIDAIIKEGWLEEATLYQLESYKKLENNKVYFVIFQEYKSVLYLILKDKLLYSYKNVDTITFELFVKSKDKTPYSNHPQNTIFSNYKYLTALEPKEVHYLLEDLVNVGLEECKKSYSSFFSRLERHVGEIKKYNDISTESLHWLVK